MTNRIKLKNTLIALLVFLLIAVATLGLGFGKNKSFFAKAEEKEVKEVAVMGVQLRADVGSDLYYLVLLTNEHAQIAAGSAVSDTTAYASLLSGIRLYTSETDETGVSAADVCKSDGWVINRWGSGGLMFPMTAENYETYSGSSVYKISVAKDVIMPCGDVDLKVLEDVQFANENYGNETNKYGSFLWTKIIEFTSSEVEITGVQIRGEVESGSYYLVLLTNEHAQVTAGLTVSDTSRYAELLSHIILYMSETDEVGVMATDVCKTDGWILNRWGSGGLMLPMTEENYELYNGTTVYKVSVEEGAVLPCGNAELTVIKDAAYMNNGYGKAESKYEAFSWSIYIGEYPQVAAELTGVQLRGSQEADVYYFVIASELYAETPFGANVPSLPRYEDLLSKIRLYTSKDDEVGVSAADICGSENWVMNLWDSHGVMFPMTTENYEKYNGTTVYKVVIEADVLIPGYGVDYLLGEEVAYVNNGYGKEESKYEAFSWSIYMGDYLQLLAELTGVQLRAEPGSGMYYFVITSELYAGVPFGANVPTLPKYEELLSKIRLYTSEEDEVGVSAADICESENWIMNLWDSHGVMFPMTAENYEKYNGTTVYKVLIEADALLPGYGVDFWVGKDSVYLNSTYGDEEAKNSGFYWSYIPANIVDLGECSLTDINNRSNSETDMRWLFLFFAETFETMQDVSGWLEQLNTLDYIEFYPTDDLTQTPISLRDVYTGSTVVKQFDQSTAMTFTIDSQYSGANMYMLVVKSGCQIPYIINGEYGYKVVATGKSFINDKYGETGDIFGLYDEMGMPRTYENWGIWWTAVSRVSFQVKGLDNVSYPTLILAAGDVIDLRDYAVEGYTVSLTTANGDRCIGGYIVPDEDTELILTYTVGSEPTDSASDGPKFGCGSVVGLGALPVSFVTAILLAKKKREDE